MDARRLASEVVPGMVSVSRLLWVVPLSSASLAEVVVARGG